MDFRIYNPAIARFNALDPVIHHSQGTSVAFDNNPIFWKDLTGTEGESAQDYENRVVWAIGASIYEREDVLTKTRMTKYIYSDGSSTTLTWRQYSYFI